MSQAPRNDSTYELSMRQDSARTVAIIVYLLYLAALVNGVTAFIGVVLAYVKRDDARGSVYESHFSNAIELFWIFLIGMVIVIPLCFIGIGFILWGLLYLYVIFRTVKGLLRASEGNPFYY
ncbi:MAG: DUF4870 domain-containing protein [Alphaproteobacteria bacterium]|nr:DUF4870 domain-containing protein [Alphaproteobacteria bacterium]